MSTTRTRAIAAVFAALDAGRSLNSVSKDRGISRATLSDWLRHPHLHHVSGCPRCEPTVPLDVKAYAHLLGLYLGDGCISALPKGVYSLRIACDDNYPDLISAAVHSVRGAPLGGERLLVPSSTTSASHGPGRDRTSSLHGPA